MTAASPNPRASAVGLPALTGPHAVGTTIRLFVDTARPEPHTADPADLREILVQLWYPAQPRPGAEPARYCPDCDLFGPIFDRLMPAPAAEELRGWRARAVPDAPLAVGPIRFPVITLSHGLQAARFAFTARAEELASHGYVVAGIDHLYGAEVVRLPDGRTIPFARAVESLDRIRLQAADVRSVADSLERLDAADPEGVFTGRLATARIGMMGHSFGGATAALACRTDQRCAAGLVYDFEILTETYGDGPHPPLMVINSARFAENNRAITSRWTGDAYQLVVEGTIHNDFTDQPLWPYSGARAGGAIQPERGLPRYRRLHARLLRFLPEGSAQRTARRPVAGLPGGAHRTAPLTDPATTPPGRPPCEWAVRRATSPPLTRHSYPRASRTYAGRLGRAA
jgi:dienelactone hydrolase